ncbi:5-formyltetrahydrofolate cyclo-ligase [Pseudoclavibacter alba]|uniref:5-formyltetrahydrofolate cyclo-ligase n=1 Tax=Pseudoclavibacter albus TaxID=272241 RepID=UPI0019D1A172|nr:5-formyltetrahydrofolate cyclo-ligase [Pseudoclavibacter alba]MBN6777387.1 5-formyltetrahydrofolate cyclo-ligase [Pseudoclavibacter alba]
MTDPEVNEKRAIRADVRQRRQAQGAIGASQAGEGISLQIQELLTQTDARRVACYLSSEFEPNTRHFLKWALEHEVDVLLPITRDDGLLDWTLSDGVSERTHQWGFPEAVGEILGPIAINRVDLLLVPAAAVAHDGTRLGWGRGFYDKTLGSMEQRPPIWAIVHDDEFVPSLPSEIHDMPVDGVITPTRALPLPLTEDH